MQIFQKHHSAYMKTSDGIRLFYDTNFNLKDYDPNRPLLVFNYGLVCNPNHFKFQYPFFEEQGYQLLIYNYRGHYNSSGLEDIDQCTFANMAKDLNELLSFLKVDNYILIGHSMGVNICLEYMSSFASPRLQKAIIISGTVLPPQNIMFNSGIVDLVTPLIEHIAKEYPDITQKVWEMNYLNPLNHKILYNGGFNTKQVSIDFVKFYAKKVSELSPHLFLQLMREMRDHDIFNRLENITTPTLIVGGDLDKIIPLHLQYIIHQKIPNSELYIIKDGSHVPQSDFPEMLNERINFFIRGTQEKFPQRLQA